ncbi:LysR family transcriptional regulator [Taklimakanibacter lacteus]|uniref:LysR family transcriptional regulator n=1 Tax=Taklimakanibacter lacteus TaxID=2268456 RepID=UPI0034D5C869
MAKPDLLPHLNWLKAFEAAARRSSFTLAADELGLTQAAISQQIRALESRLGTALFHRRQRGVTLTPEGSAYLPHIQSAFAGLARSTQELFGRRPAQTITLLSPISFATLWLTPRLRSIEGETQGLSLDITTMHTPDDYEASETVFDIRFGLGDWPGRRAYRLTTERLRPVAAPQASRRRTDIWQRLPLLAVRGAREMWPDWFALAGLPPQGPARYRFDSFVAALGAAEAGAGILLGSRPLIDAALARKTLLALSDIELQSAAGHFITHEAGRPLTPAQALFLAAIMRTASLRTG